MTRITVAYLRRSVVSSERPGTVSQEVQLARVRALAGDDVLVFQDWGRSGRGSKSARRTQYQQMLDMIRRDEVERVVSYNLSRLARSMADILTLVEVCRKHGTSIVLADGLPVDPTSAVGRLIVQLFGAINEFMAELSSEAAIEGRAARLARDPGGYDGVRPFGSDPKRPDETTEPVLAAFDEAGSYTGAARVLTDRRVPTRGGKAIWHAKVVRAIVCRERPEMAAYVRQGIAACGRSRGPA